MDNRRRHRPMLLVITSLFMAFVLLMLPVPELLRILRPDVVLLVLIFWLMRTPESIGIGFAWLLGFVVDGTTGSFLGQHALSFSCVAYMILLIRQRVQMLAVGQQAILVLALLGFDQLVSGWVNIVMRGGEYHFYFLVSPFVGALVWPLLYAWLSHYQRTFARAHPLT